MTKKRKKQPQPFTPPEYSEGVLDGQTVVGWIYEVEGGWRAVTPKGRSLGVFKEKRSAMLACPKAPSERS